MATHITLVAVVCWLILDSTLVGKLLAFSHQLVPQDLNVLHGLQQTVSGRKVEKPTLICHQMFELQSVLLMYLYKCNLTEQPCNKSYFDNVQIDNKN